MNLKISVAFFKGGEEIGQNSGYLHHSVNTPFEQGTNRQINISADVYYSVASWSRNNIICKVYINNQYYDEFPIEGTEMFFNRIQSNSRRRNSPKNATEQRSEKSNKSSSLPKNTVRFEIINEGIVENIPSKGHIDLDTLNHIWNIHTERGDITNLKKWKNNPYHQENLYLDDKEGDYIIEPWVYALGEDRYYIKFAKNEAGGTEFRITTQSAMQYLKLWYP